jgi:hypothetical protein
VKTKNTFNISVEKPVEKRLCGRPSRRRENNIKMYLTEAGNGRLDSTGSG